MELTRENMELVERDLCKLCTGRRAQFSVARLCRMRDYLAPQKSPVEVQLRQEIEVELRRRELRNI